MDIKEKMIMSRLSRVYRANNNLTQTELGKMCGVSQRIISYLENLNENNLSKISKHQIEKIKKILEVYIGLQTIDNNQTQNGINVCKKLINVDNNSKNVYNHE